jgi:hypothetical protein
MFGIAERLLSDIIDKHGQHPILIDRGTWYPHQACRFLKLNHHLHFLYIIMRKASLKELGGI